MDIRIIKKYGLSIIISSSQIEEEIIETVTENLYEIDEFGKKNMRNKIGEDVSTEILENFNNALWELIEERTRDFDSADLIKALWDKLPYHKQQELDINKTFIPEMRNI